MTNDATTMQEELVVYCAGHLLESVFQSKRAMADALNMPYRVLLKVCGGNGGSKDIVLVMSVIIRYCIRNRIHIDEILPEFRKFKGM